MTGSYDLAIVGGGFAGLVCARSAALRGLRTVVLERQPAPGHRIHTTGLLVKEVAERWEAPPRLTRRIRGVRLYGPSLSFIDLESPGYYFLATDTPRLMFVSPLMLTALAVPLLKERVGLHRWSAVVIGFLGVLIIVRPGGTTMQWAALLPLLTAFLYALYQIATRVLSRTTPSLVTFAYMVVVGTAGSTLALPFVWRTPDALGWVMMAASGLLHGLAHYLVTRAFALAPAAILAPFNYAQLIGATAFGYFVFGDLPDRWTIVGALVIVAAGLYVAYRERWRRTLAAIEAAQDS